MAQMDLFGMLGLAPAEEKKETKKETTKKGSGKKSTSKSGGTTTSDTFKVGTEGITLISGYYPEKTLSLSDLDKELEDGQEEVEITASELVKAAIKNGLESFIEGHTKTAKLKSGKILLASDGIKMNESKDGFSGEWRILLGGYETTVSGEKFTCKEVQETWYASYPEHTDLTDFQFDEARKVFVPFFKQQKMKETKNGTVTIWGQTPYPFENKKASEAAKETYTEQLEENYHIVPYEEDKFFVVPYLKTGTAAVKETTYPTKDVVLSLVFTKIPLSPDMFGGKEEVNEKELLKFICADYPEYGSGRASVQYLKKEKMIMVSIKSAKKGALAVSFDAKNESEVPEKISEALNYSASRNYSLCYVTVPSTKKYRVEKTELGMFVGGDEAYNAFSMNLPKIPKEIMEEIYSFFLAVKNYMPRSNEAAAQIFWDKRKKEYLVYYPKQYVSTVEVDFHRDMFLENDENFVLVMDVHSHGIIRPMFSGTDDMDEKGTRLFCVFGNMEDTTMYHFSLRAGTGGHFIKVNEEEIFDNFFDGMFTNGNVVNPDARRTQKIAEIIAEKVSFR